MTYNEEPGEQAREATAPLALQPSRKKACSPPKQAVPHGRIRRARGRSTWESGDHYAGALFSIPNTPWRVAVCAKGHCWILQRCRGKDRWDSQKFFVTKRRLATVIRELLGDDAYVAVADQIEALPM